MSDHWCQIGTVKRYRRTNLSHRRNGSISSERLHFISHFVSPTHTHTHTRHTRKKIKIKSNQPNRRLLHLQHLNCYSRISTTRTHRDDSKLMPKNTQKHKTKCTSVLSFVHSTKTHIKKTRFYYLLFESIASEFVVWSFNGQQWTTISAKLNTNLVSLTSHSVWMLDIYDSDIRGEFEIMSHSLPSESNVTCFSETL